MSSLFGRFSLSIIFISSLYAESFEDFQRAQSEAFTKYRDERDAAFNGYLKAQWEEYTATMSKPLYEKPKPRKIAPTVQKKIQSVGPVVNIKIQPVKPIVKEEEKQVVKKEVQPNVKKVEEKKVVQQEVTPIVKKIVVVKEKKVEVPKVKDLNFDFFGEKLGFDIDNKFKTAKFYPQNQTGILNYFNVIASSDYENTIKDIKNTAKTLQLNDWGVYLLVTKFSSALYSDPDNVNLFSWFMFNKLGYSVKVGLADKHVILMHYSKKIIYSTPNYTFKDRKFYVVSHYAKGSVGKLYTYKQDYPEATRALDLELKQLPNLKKDLQSKTISFNQFGTEYSTTYHYDKNLIDFMATYPQADYETYFNAPMSENAYKEIANDIKKYVDAKQYSVAINFVLNFVQKAFEYQMDNEQFGREKVMFADETLYYDKSDCEDRAILFSYLVKELFGVGVVGVKYKDHMATALYIPMKGDMVKNGQKEYVIADPTYINSNIGQSMPQYKSEIPQSFIRVGMRTN